MVQLAAMQEAKVLVVGAGGIGCELLKTLTLSAFEQIHVIDMDTIEVSNLNRQFLFRKRHVGRSKAKVARDALLKFRPNAQIVAHHANVKSLQFDVEFFQQFSLVLNGLDNLDARRHVNRMCLAAHVPLVESGTTGYLGQVSVHLDTKSKRTECYECQPKPAPKSYPVCTITSTPSKPVHCVVWAKDLAFMKLFGDKRQVSDLDTRVRSDDQVGTRDAELSIFEPLKDESSSAFAIRIFDRLFGHNVAIALENEEAWKERRKPTPLFLADAFNLRGDLQQKEAVEPVVSGKLGGAMSATAELGLNNPQQIWSVSSNAKVFLETVRLYLDTRTAEVGKLTFDKDDQLAVEFVTSAANLRAYSFGIPMQSLFHAKGIAGNIVHAVATTNAIVAGLMVLESFKIFSQDLDACRMTFCLEHPSRKLLLMPVEPFEQNPSCYVCSQTPLALEIDTSTATLRDVVDKIVMRQIGATSPMIMVESTIVFETGDDLDEVEVAHFEKNLDKQLLTFPTPIVSGTVLFVADLQQDFRCSIHVKHREAFSEEEVDGMVLHRLGCKASLPLAEQAVVPSQSKTAVGDSIQLVTPNDKIGINKRQAEDVEIGDPTKKVKI